MCQTGCFVIINSVFLIKATKYSSDIAHSQNTSAPKITVVDASTMWGGVEGGRIRSADPCAVENSQITSDSRN